MSLNIRIVVCFRQSLFPSSHSSVNLFSKSHSTHTNSPTFCIVSRMYAMLFPKEKRRKKTVIYRFLLTLGSVSMSAQSESCPYASSEKVWVGLKKVQQKPSSPCADADRISIGILQKRRLSKCQIHSGKRGHNQDASSTLSTSQLPICPVL